MNYESEITVEVCVDLSSLIKILEENGFELKEVYDLNDIYLINKNDKEDDYLSMLNKCVLIRNIIEEDKETKLLTYKYKEYNENKEITRQGKVKVKIDDISNSKLLFEKLGFQELIRINDHIMVYEKDGLELAIEYVNDKYLFIEVEANQKYDTIDKMKNALEEVGIEYDKSNYFQKKALLIFKDKYNSKI